MAETRTPFAEDLEKLRAKLLYMGAAVDRMLDSAILALTKQDVALTRQVVRSDDEIDRLDVEIEAECFRLIALQSPVSRDLRVIGTALKAITDIERIGDYAVDIAKIGRRIQRNAFYQPLVDLPYLADLVRQMLRDVLQAFVEEDVGLVRKVVEADSTVDDEFHRQRDHLVTRMQQDPGAVYVGTFLLFAAKYLERAADHVVNIAERVNYMVTGQLEVLASDHAPGS
jgi:phosphate transport system protein